MYIEYMSKITFDNFFISKDELKKKEKERKNKLEFVPVKVIDSEWLTYEELDKRIKSQKGVEVIFSKVKNANHFFKEKEQELRLEVEKYIKEKTALI